MPNSNKFPSLVETHGAPNPAVPAGASAQWDYSSNLGADDGSVANSPILANSEYSRFISAYKFDHTVPAGATIDGIEVLIDRVAGGLYSDYEVRLSNGVNAVYTDSRTADIGSSWSSNFGVATYGGPTDTWGRTWTVSEVNHMFFSASLSLQGPSSPNLSQRAEVDYIKTIIYYTEAGGGGGPDFNIKIGGQSISRIMMGDQPIGRVNHGSTSI